MKRTIIATLLLVAALIVSGCGAQEQDTGSAGTKTTVMVFAAASLGPVMEEFEASYEEAHSDVDIVVNADSSQTLLTQIEEGAQCDVFFSAAQKQMDELEEKGLVVEGTRRNVVNNQLVVITRLGSGTEVTGLADIEKAKGIALADGSVPAGKYTRQAMMALGLIEKADDPSAVTTKEVSEQLGGVEISDQGNVSKVLIAVEEGAAEVGTTYLSDTIGHEESVEIIQTVPTEVTGEIIYPAAQVVNKDADDAETAAAADFISFITSDEAKAVYKGYGFDTDVD